MAIEALKFPLGSVVRLASGGPTMTIVSNYPARGDDSTPLYRCMWFFEGKFAEVMVPEPGLVLPGSRSGKVLPKVWGGLLRPDGEALSDEEIGELRQSVNDPMKFADAENTREIVALLLDMLDLDNARIVELSKKDG